MLNASRFGDVLRIELARSLLGRGWYWTTAYLVGKTLIDTGPAHTADALLRYLQDIPIKQVLNTHAHEDHIGANGPLQRSRDGLKIYAHPDAIPILENPATNQPLQLYRQIMWGWPEPCEADPITDGDIVEDGDLRWQVMHTPGHTQHHLCFFEPNHGWLFCGDLFVGGRDRAFGAGNDIWQIITSLKRLADLPLQTLFPGAARVRSNPNRELRTRIHWLEDLGERILALHQKGWGVGRIAREVSGGPMFIELFTGGHFSRRHLVHSYLNQPRTPLTT
jgi:glyoxylase-like metal-dependent hydrolase (beta-lactamase superfamily II)